MLRKVRPRDLENPVEVAKELNKVIDELNKTEEYNAEVDAYNEGLIEKGDIDA